MKQGQIVYSEKNFYLWLAVAATLHIIVLSTPFFLKILDARKPVEPRMVSITLVSLPTAERAPAIAATPFVKQASLHPAEKTEPHAVYSSTPLPNKSRPTKIVALEKMPAPKSAEKQDLSSALERLKQVVSNKAQPQQPSPGSTVKTALAELEKRVNAEKVPAVSGGSGERVGVSGGNSGTGKEYGGSGESLTYKMKIASIIQRNWELANPLLKNSFGMKVLVRINIFSDGSIGQILFVKKSLSEYLNNSVKKALEKSSPLPPLPKGEGARGVWVQFVFTPEGIEQ
jgi:colicin import membrane protein